MKKFFLNILLLIIPLLAFSQDCNSINITTGNSSITIDNLNAPIVQAQVFDLQNGWQLVLNCAGDCNTPTETVTDLATGDYLVKVTYYDASWTPICVKEQTVTITGNSCDNQGGDSDSDGVCDAVDCQPNNPDYPATPGFTCDDGDDSTNNDIVTADGCGCQGDNNPPPPNCSTIEISTGNGSITISGLVAPVVAVRLIDLATNEYVYSCIDNCTLPTVNITGLAAGDYQLRVSFNENDGSDQAPLDGTPICGLIEIYTITATTEDISLNCPADILLDPVPGNLVTFTWPVPTGSTTCAAGGLTITQIGGPTLGTQLLANNGTYEITYEATDNCGNSTQCSFNVTEQFWFADIAFTNCPADINVNASSANGAVVNWEELVLETNCPAGAGISQSTGLANGSIFPIGTTQLVFQGIGSGVGNGCGVSTVCLFDVTVTEDTGGGGGDTDCSSINVTAGSNSITVGGLNAPIVQLQIFDLQNGWQLVTNCAGDCNIPTETANYLAEGEYLVKVTFYDESWTTICVWEETIFVGTDCDSLGGDSDNDGICDPEDCQPNNPNYPATPGFTCDDGDDSTNNDVVTADGCGCQGDNNPGPPDCSTIGISTGNGSITVTGLMAPVVAVRLIDLATDEFVYSCIDNCTLPTVNITGLVAGNYQLRVLFYQDNSPSNDPLGGDPVCGVIENLTVTNDGGTPCAEAGGDSDNDGVCNDDDCQPNDPFFPNTPGVTCNDGNDNTNNDIVQADGCSCAGTPNTSGNGADLTLSIDSDAVNVSPYSDFSVDVTVTNEGTQTSSDVVVNVPQPQNVVFQGGNSFTSTQGDYDPFSTFNWNVGTLAAGQSATITFNYFSLAGAPYTIYGQVQSMAGTDIDSTPGNGTAPTPNEDDEAVYLTDGSTPGGGGGGSPACTLSLVSSVTNIVCNDNGSPDNDTDDTFTFDLVVDSSGPWGWTGGGQSGAYGQTISYGPYNISAGIVNFTATDNDNITCTTNISVNPPSSCSNDNGNGGGGNSTNDCSDISVTTSGSDIILSGVAGEPLTAVWVYDLNDNWNLVFDCSYECSSTETVAVGAGSYRVVIKRMLADWTVVCEVIETITINQFTDEAGELRQENSSLDVLNSDFSVYPNPSSGFININLAKENVKSVTINLTDRLGRRVYSRNTSYDAFNHKLDASQFAAGIYFLTIQMDNEVPLTKQVVLIK